MSSSSNETVRDQFSALQKQQKDRLSKISTKKKEMSFEVDAGPFPIDDVEPTVQLRELKDENGRLRKLLAEKDYEIGYLRRMQEEERQAFVGKVSAAT